MLMPCHALDDWDLTPLRKALRRKLVSASEIEVMLAAYKDFVRLVLKYPNEKFGVSKDVDTVWHEHILDTRDYFAFCDRVYGKYLHHIPCFDESQSQEYDLANTLQHLTVEGMSLDGWLVQDTTVSHCGGTIEFDLCVGGQSHCGGGQDDDGDEPSAPKPKTVAGSREREAM